MNDDGLREIASAWAEEQAEEMDRIETLRQEQRLSWDGPDGQLARKEVSRFSTKGEVR